jgi:signal transduction histidine kinase
VSEVPVRVVRATLAFLSAHHPEIDLDALLSGLSVGPERFREGQERVPWNDVVVVLDRIEQAAGGPDGLMALGAEFHQERIYSDLWRLAGRMASADLLYLLADRLAQLNWPFLERRLSRLPDGSFMFELAIPEPLAPSAAFMRINHALYQTLPRLLGQPDAQIESRIAPRFGQFWVRPPTLWRFWRLTDAARWVLATPQALKLFGPAASELQARYRELMAARHKIEQQEQRLRVEVAEREQAEAERVLANARLRQQQKLDAIGMLAAGVAHEINNPVQGIMNYARLLQRELPSDSRGHDFATEILAESRRVSHIVRDLLVFARRDRDTPGQSNPSDIIHGTLTLVRAVLQDDAIILRVDLPPSLPDILCREQQIRQVLMNLVTNARDALNARYPEAHPEKVVRISATLEERVFGTWVRISVEDHGVGVEPDDAERIFEPFFTTKEGAQGTGLGLFVSHGIVRDHGGALHLEAAPGQPTRFHVDLPVGDEAEDAIDASSDGRYAV